MSAYQALYRKYRPQTFDDVSGQLAVTQTLKTQIVSGKLSHAYLFTGSRGTGKTSCAKILAKAVNCLNPQDGNPCNCCTACKAIDSGACMDVLEIDAASNNGVDNVRDLRDDAIYTPSQVKMRVYIIDEVHMLSISAFNALLKIIEEPPEHLLFILATTELHKVPATILSRCQRFSFRRISHEDIAARLQFVAYQENIDLDDSAARVLARMADGGMRDGLSLLDQCASATTGELTAQRVYACLGIAGEQKCGELMQYILRDVLFALGPMVLGLLLLYLLRWRINLLSLGGDACRTMGVHAGRLRLAVIFAATLITAASVSVSGLVGWVGLVTPHLCRKLVGSDHRHLLPVSMLFGAMFLLAVDGLARNLLATEIPIGILTALIGAPFFLYLITRKERLL